MNAGPDASVSVSYTHLDVYKRQVFVPTASLKECLVEESGEVIDAIDNDDDENLCEELGDVLLQVVMHAQIAAERGSVTIDDVVQGLSLIHIYQSAVRAVIEAHVPESGIERSMSAMI